MNECQWCGKPVKNKYCNVSCQNKHQNHLKTDKKFGKYETFTISCSKCQKEFEIIERTKLFPQKQKYYCSRNCANSRTWSDDDKKKKSKSLKGKVYKKISERKNDTKKDSIFKYVEYVDTQCKNCNRDFNHLKKHKRMFCSRSCVTTFINNTTDRCNRGGLKSSQVQQKTRRSKNEIYFSKLCETHFKNVLTNEQMFNGWDADVILINEKVGILWNGKWHYEKITKKHSVEQVQNRDKIKIHEILKYGYTPYTIKDMGKYNKEFVDTEFEKFLNYMRGRLELVPAGAHNP